MHRSFNPVDSSYKSNQIFLRIKSMISYIKNMTKNNKFLVILVVYTKQFLWVQIELYLLITIDRIIQFSSE